jgi:diguanylate cyclase (GGDEF)-like protein/PAS domain S-box-containing protein
MDKEPSYEELKEKLRYLEQKARTTDILSHQIFEERQFLKILIDTIPSPIFHKDREGVYRHCNEAFSRDILGLGKEQIIDKSLFDLPDEIPVKLAQLYRKKDLELFENPGTQVYKSTVKCADGKDRTYQFHKSTILNESGKAVGLVGIMMDITRLEQTNVNLESLSYIDALTSVFNRRKFDAVFPQLLKKYRPTGALLNVAVIDIDHFKSFNDTYGHPAGDEALKSVAHTIQQNLTQSSGKVFRIGGEEFCALYFSYDEANALYLAEKIRTDVASLPIRNTHHSTTGSLTISMGLLSLHSHLIDVRRIHEEADQLMYRAKHEGRNKVVQRTI